MVVPLSLEPEFSLFPLEIEGSHVAAADKLERTFELRGLSTLIYAGQVTAHVRCAPRDLAPPPCWFDQKLTFLPFASLSKLLICFNQEKPETEVIIIFLNSFSLVCTCCSHWHVKLDELEDFEKMVKVWLMSNLWECCHFDSLPLWPCIWPLWRPCQLLMSHLIDA